MNTSLARSILQSLNPSVSFQVGDVNRLPIFPVESADQIYTTIDQAFTEHEAARESSVEFRKPGPSPWKYAQAWAQVAVDRPAGEPLPPYVAEYEPARSEQLVSFAVGVALGRFAADGAGILDRAPDSALPHGILFLSAASERDSLFHPACALLHKTWDQHASAVGEGDDLRTYLRTSFFKFHKDLYENRPIYFPLSSAKKSFVAWVAIHRFDDSTLQTLLAEHLNSERRTLDGELEDLRKARASADKAARGKAEKRFAEVQKLFAELVDFIDKVQECAEHGPPAADPKAPPRQADARFHMDLDDGVMVNSAALWPLLEPQWKDPRKWWKELATADGRKDYDWAHLAARYFPRRVEEKCKTDPSLAVAHGCFWKHHPARAYAWELRLQDELRPDFTIDEPDSDSARVRFLTEQADHAQEIRATEERRRERKRQKNARADEEGDEAGGSGPLFDGAGAEEEEHA